MADKRKAESFRIDTKEFELPETMFVRDIENKVVQGIILQCLSRIEGISLLEGNFIDNILGREEGIKGIIAEQDLKTHSISVKVEINIMYGLSIPQKAEEIQEKIAEELTRITGLRVSQVHVVFKELVTKESMAKALAPTKPCSLPIENTSISEEYTDEF